MPFHSQLAPKSIKMQIVTKVLVLRKGIALENERNKSILTFETILRKKSIEMQVRGSALLQRKKPGKGKLQSSNFEGS